MIYFLPVCVGGVKRIMNVCCPLVALFKVSYDYSDSTKYFELSFRPIKQASQDLQNVKINFKNRFKEGSLYGRFRAILCMYKVNPKANPIILLLIII